jgi:hypothetical protein
LILSGCEQAANIQKQATDAYGQASQQVQNAKASVLDAKNKLDQKVKDVQDAAAAINKLTK